MAKIVVADDEPEVRRALVGILREAGHETQEAYDGLSALDAVRDFKPDMLLLDWMIPELFGGEVLDMLRNNAEYAEFKDLPVIVVSDFDDDGSIRQFKEAGATDFLAKKEDLDQMRELLLKRVKALL